MGVDIVTYRSRIGNFWQGHGLQIVQILVTCNFTGLLKMIGSVIFIGTLLLMSGIEPNPGPLPFEKREDTSKDFSVRHGKEEDTHLQSLQQTGFDKSTVLRAVRNVTVALVKKSASKLRWPVIEREKSNIMQGFYQYGGFPHVIGAIDGTHVRIIAPSDDEPSFVYRKGKFTNINAMWPGSSHDAHIFRSSQARTCMEQHEGFDHGIFLGDSGYPCKPYLMTPYRFADTPQKQ